MKSSARKFTKMTGEQLAAATAEFDKEFVADAFAPLDDQGRARWGRIKRKRGRPRRGQGAKVICVSVERGLLRRADALARRRRTTRAAVISRGLRAVLAAESATAESA
jgi:hypothetical protein